MMRTTLWTVVLLAALAVFPLVAPALGLDFYISFVRRVLIYALAATSLNLILGYGGMVALGHAAFFGAGAYAVGILAMSGITSVQVGMGEEILILVLVCIVIGGIGSIRGAFVGALLVGMVDTAGRAFLPMLLRQVFSPAVASSVGPTLAAIAIYVLMAAVLVFRPSGLFPARG